MRHSLYFVLPASLLAFGLVSTGCGGDEENDIGNSANTGVLSGAGQSCARTSDCEKGLLCLNNVCGNSGETPPIFGTGTEGESCQKRADCVEGLGCFANVCAPSATPEQPTPLGGRGESCEVVADCAAGMTCVSVSNGATSRSVCDIAEYGIEPTGKTCSAECRTAADCAEIPLSLRVSPDASTCTGIAAKIQSTPINCATTADAEERKLCFLQTTYCAADAAARWACNAGTCSYTANCTANGLMPGGCPTASRTERPLYSLCDLGATNKCQPPGAPAACTTDASCVGKTTPDRGADVCQAGDCKCHNSTACYFKCSKDLDCTAGQTCDATTNLCVSAGQCDTDAQCAQALNDVAAKCVDRVCKRPCANDHACSPSGIPSQNSFSGMVCSAAGFCEQIGCTSDQQCAVNVPGGQLRTFCEAPAAGGGAGVSSAITSGAP